VTLPDDAYLAGLAAIPGMGPAHLLDALEGCTPAEAWAAERDRPGAPPDLDALWAGHVEAGIAVLGRDHPQYPEVLRDDPDPPTVLFCRGDLSALDRRRVAIVGTRRATEYGLGVARRLGARLAREGVAVVSGLARGIDGAAHQGLLRAGGAPPIGVVGTGLDVVYPRQHRQLWDDVAEAGLLLSEAPLGTRPDRWRFPARNRIIAALSEVVVVVESRRQGGSLYTVEDAIRRDRPVLAVPGPVTSAASYGTNRLIADGAQPVCDGADVLLSLGLVSPERDAGPPEPGGAAGRVLDATAWEPVTLDTLATRTRLSLPQLAAAIDDLCRQGWLVDQGGTYERTTPTSARSGA
jgi:DNA processing protein